MATIKRMTAMDHEIEAKLSLRQLQVFTLYGRGRDPDQIGRSLFISKKTVWTHKSDIVKIMGFKNTHEFIYHAIKWVNFNNNKEE